MNSGDGPVCVSVINMKGGVGKTTIAAMLCYYAPSNLDVLAIDLDPQANLSQALMGDTRYRQFLDTQAPSIVEIFRGYQPPSQDTGSPGLLDSEGVVVDTSRLGGPNVRVIPSRFDFSDNLINSLKPDETVLARCIAEHFQDKDIIIIDCAPTESIFTRAAYHASRHVLVPVKPEYFATIGFPLLNDSLRSFRDKNRGHQIDVIGVVINNSSYHYSGNQGGPERRVALEEIHEEAEQSGWHVFENEIPLSRGFPKMMRGNFSRLGDAGQFRFFAEEFFQALGFDQD